jgi:protein-S-isoprenylcysteine O-methyltransferase Ste14
MSSSYAWLVQILWAAWLTYWIVSAANVKATRQRESIASRSAHFIPMIAAAALILTPRIGAGEILFTRFVPSSAAVSWCGCVLVFAGLGFSAWARVHLGGNWSSRVTVKEDHELIRSGPYALVRHPIYTGLLLAIAGTALVEGQWRALLALLLMGISFWRKLRVEERLMNLTFADEYRQYCAHTAALIPFLL